MKQRILLFICTVLFTVAGAQNPFLKTIKDSLSLKNFGEVAFIDSDSLFIHLLFNSNYDTGGYCDGSNGSIYYLKLNKSNGQIIAYRSITSTLVMRTNAARLYKGNIYLGGEMANPFLDRSAFVMKFNTQSLNIVWQRNFNMKWYAAAADPSNPCKVTDIALTPNNDSIVFYGTGFCKPGFNTGQLSSFKGIIDTNNNNFSGVYYAAYMSSVNTRFTNGNGGAKAYLITHDNVSGNVQIVTSNDNKQLWTSDQGLELNMVSTGRHYVGKFGKLIVYLIDKPLNSTCIVTDSTNTILLSKEFSGLHARALVAEKNSAVLTFVNDVGSGKGIEIVHVKIDSLLNYVSGKKMYLDTFSIADFNCTSSMDPNFTYCLFSKKSFSSSEIFVHKLDFTNLTCNEQFYTPLMNTVSTATLFAILSTTASVAQTTFSPYTFNKGLKDSLFCFPQNPLLPQPDFTAPIICAGNPFIFSGSSSNSPTSWYWNMPGAVTPTSNMQNPTVTYPSSGIYNVTLTATNFNGTGTVIKAVTVAICEGIEENTGVFATIFPNPAMAQLEIICTAEIQEFSMLNSNGMRQKVPVFYTHSEHQALIDVRDLPSGIYLLQLTTGGRNINKRVIVEH